MSDHHELSNIIKNLGKYQKTIIETEYPAINDEIVYAAVMGCDIVDVHMRAIPFPPECTVTFLYDEGEINFAAYCVPLEILAYLTDPTFAPNYKEEKEFPYASFTINDIEFRVNSITNK